LNEEKLDLKASNNLFFSVTGMTGQNQHNWPDFFLSGNVFLRHPPNPTP